MRLHVSDGGRAQALESSLNPGCVSLGQLPTFDSSRVESSNLSLWRNNLSEAPMRR